MDGATGLDLIAEAAQHPTMDELMARDPRAISPEERRRMIEHFRQERAAWLAKEDKKATKKAEKEAA